MNRNQFQKAAKMFRAGRLTLDEFTEQTLESGGNGNAADHSDSLAVYLFFDGQCREAFEHYQKVFDAKELCVQTYSDGPPDMFGEEPADNIMHTTIRIGDSMLMGSDITQCARESFNAGNNLVVMFRPATREEADERFEQLASGGTITMPLQNTFWGSYFGTCTDRFGIHWKFNFSNSKS